MYANFIPSKVKKAAGDKSTTAIGAAFVNRAVLPARKVTKARTFRKGTLVRHEKFGLGVVHAAQKQLDGQLCLTVAFGKEHKKVLSTFLHTVRP